MYKQLPFVTCLSNFSAVFNDVFIFENPSHMLTYSLMEVQIVELTKIESPQETFNQPFRFNFANGTSKSIDYVKSRLFYEKLKLICRQIKQKDNNLGDEVDL